jgi:hypothetical protein
MDALIAVFIVSWIFYTLLTVVGIIWALIVIHAILDHNRKRFY